MKKLIALLLVFCVIAFGSCGADSDGPSTLPDGENSPMVSYSESIVFITTGEGGSFWDNVKKGTQEASKKYGVNVIFKGLGRENLFSEEAQSALLKEASQSGADAVIISSVGSGLTEAIEAAFEKGVPVVEFENGLSATDKNSLSDGGKSIISSRIFSDEKEAGMLCADSVFEKIKELAQKNEEKIKIGLIYNERLESNVQRAAGFEEKIFENTLANKMENRIEIIKKPATKGGFNNAVSELEESEARLIFLCSESAADGVADEVYRDSEEYKDILFCGFDSGKKQLKWMAESEKFLGSVTRDGYNMGYNAVLQAVSAFRGEKVKPEIDIGVHWYTKESIEKMQQDNLIG